MIQRRIVLSAGLLVMAFALVGVRLVDVMVLKGRVTGATADLIDELKTKRADLLDRNGQLLARNLPVADLYAEPKAFREMPDHVEAVHNLAGAAGVSEKRLDREFQSKHAHVLVALRLPPDVQARVGHLGLPGLEFDPAQKRYYPQGFAAVQVVGATDPDGNGIAGLELGLDHTLKSAKDGVAVSLDMRVQYALSHEIEEARKEFGARAGGGIVLDVTTGEILAMASLPDSESDASALQGVDPRRNRMAADDYELGSVFKIFSFALAMEDHTTRLDEQFKIAGGFRVGKYTIHDAERMPAMLAARDVLAQSSNAGTAQIALRSGPTRQRAFLEKLGLLSAVQSDLPERRLPMFPSNLGEVETATVGFGNGISVTPLAFVTAAAA